MKVSNVRRLELDAKHQGISVNALIQKSIQRFIDWDRCSDSASMTSFFPNMLDGVLEFIDEETAEKIGTRIIETSCFKDACLMIFRRYDLDAFIRLMTLMDKFGNNYRVQQEETKLWSSVSLYHNYGKKWSILVGTILHGALLRLGEDHTYELSDNATVLRFDRML
jgi:hypothetical protein